MKFVSSAMSVSLTQGLYGGSMASGEKLAGTLVVDVPLIPQYSYVDDTVSFSQYPRKINHFGDCEHYKITGTVYLPSNNGSMTTSSSRSVFGQIYDQEGVARNIIARTATAYESWPHVYGNYNNNQEGMWVFALAVKRSGNRVFGVTGLPDLQDDTTPWGRYQFSLREFRVEENKVLSRYTVIYSRSGAETPRTSECSPLKALGKYRDLLLTAIEESSWSIWDQVYTMTPVNTQILQLPSVHQVFPPADLSVKWGELAADAYNSVPFFSSNGIAYAKDLRNLKKSAEQTLSLIKSFGKAGKFANKIANLFLSFYYGWRLFVYDTQELYQSIEKRNRSLDYLNRATSQRKWEAHGATYLATFQCYYYRYANATKLDQFILDYDLALTPENIWDLIPFSFVVDWFTGIGQALETASSNYTFMQMHEVLCSGRSIKAIKNVNASKLHPGWQGTIKFSYYNRSYIPAAYRPTFSFSNSVNPLDHLIEGTALIVSRR